MIDKNDVKMPVQRKDVNLISNDEERVKDIEELLQLVNQAEKKQELRLKGDYYSRFHWFGSNAERSDKSYFSYQEEAVYDFVFNLNKSGILSDQVGMGKTIEAGMIISELASRNELRSLLIIVPNEIMAQKWEYELENKFGIKEYRRKNSNMVEEVYPTVKALKNYDDFCRCVFDCVAAEKFVEFSEYDFAHKYKADPNKAETLAEIIEGFVKADIASAVEMINNGFDIWEMPGNPKIKFDGKEFSIVGTNFKKEYKYDAKGIIAHFLNGKQRLKQLEGIINNAYFARDYKKIIKQELDSMFVIIGNYFTTLPEEISAVSETMVSSNPILVIPIAFSEYKGEQVYLKDFLNHPLLPEIKNYRHKYNVQDKEGNIDVAYEDYRIVDFFIDVGYQTLIVDEVHDYIDVCAKMERSNFHKNDGYNSYPSSDYNRYELFDDYYFIHKKSLYKKLKSLADKANRKIFLTATPIKSDMVDFYLLTLLASNKDSEAYRKISEGLKVGADGQFAFVEEVEGAIDELYNLFLASVDSAAEYFCNHSSSFFREEERDASAEIKDEKRAIRYVYPYFNNKYLRANTNNLERVKEYLLSHMSYLSVEEIVMDLILAYNAEKKESNDISTTIDKVKDVLLSSVSGSEILTRIVFRTLLNNTIKIRFEEDFTDNEGAPIKRIRELLEYDDGPRKWHKTYRKYGIRHTRHQTYNLTACDSLEKLNKTKMERYKNLPVWPRRDGKVIFLVRDDNFFDSFVNVRRNLLPEQGSKEVRIEDLPNIDKLTGNEDEKQQKFQNAVDIFNYINNSMSGGNPTTHEPQSSKYESVDLDDSGMVEYKLALVNKLMRGSDAKLGSVSKKVLLFAENGRDEIVDWFRYQKRTPLYTGEALDEAKSKEYQKKWQSYDVEILGDEWKVSENTEDLNRYDGNLLVIIDPKRYEKGVDLQKADTIINFDINYCPLKMEQRIGRIDRIRPKGQSQGINIVSFVPLNDMSGFVINFFANELKMFTQWMGETTGIVSVPEEESAGANGEDVSFEGKVYNLERYYKHIYNLCRGDVDEKTQAKMVEDFGKFLKTNNDNYKYKTASDFKFIQALRSSFDKAFCSSISPQRAGYSVKGTDKKVMRFNSALGVFSMCDAESCDSCKSRDFCNMSGKTRRNSFADFSSAVSEFFDKGAKFYQAQAKEMREVINSIVVHGAGNNELQEALDWMQKRESSFKKEKDNAMKALSSMSSNVSKSFTVPYSKYEEVFKPMKRLFWDEAVNNYIKVVLDQFYKQCDSVLKSARLFEKFVKTLSIADFMNNMEGTL